MSRTPWMVASELRISGTESPRGVPSSRIFIDSRTMEMELHRISAAMSSESTGSIQLRWVKRMAGQENESQNIVNATLASKKKRGVATLHHHTRRGNDHHEPWLDRDRTAETVDGLDRDAARNDDEGQRIEECRQHAGALVAEGL